MTDEQSKRIALEKMREARIREWTIKMRLEQPKLMEGVAFLKFRLNIEDTPGGLEAVFRMTIP
jgi:hypothetical protein